MAQNEVPVEWSQQKANQKQRQESKESIIGFHGGDHGSVSSEINPIETTEVNLNPEAKDPDVRSDESDPVDSDTTVDF